MSTKATATRVSCSFCGKPQDDVEKIVAGPGVFICNECVDLCVQIIRPPTETDSETFFTALAQRNDDELLDMMATVAASRDRVDETVGMIVRQLRERGVTWGRIGDRLGITKQSAWERYSAEE